MFTYQCLYTLKPKNYPNIYGIQISRAIISQSYVLGINEFTSNSMVSNRAYWELSKNITMTITPNSSLSFGNSSTYTSQPSPLLTSPSFVISILLIPIYLFNLISRTRK